MARLDAFAPARSEHGVPPALAVAAALAIVAFVATIAFTIAGVVRVLTASGGAGGDFLSFYAAGDIVRHGMTDRLYSVPVQSWVQHAVYPGNLDRATGYPLPLVAAWFFAPISRLPFAAAYVLWLCANVAMLAALVVALERHLARVPVFPRRVFLTVFACSMPVAANLVFGQVDFIIFAALFGGYQLLRRDREVAAGVVLAAVLLKPQFLLGVVPMLMFWRQWRTLAALAVGGTALLVLPALLSHPGELADNVRFVWHYPGAGQDLSVNAARRSNLLAGRRWQVARDGRIAADQSYALAVLVPLLVSPHLHTQSLMLLFIPAAIALRGLFPPGDEAAGRFERQTAIVALLLAAYAALFAGWVSTSLGFAPFALLVAAAFGAVAWRWPQPMP
jgi:Glycosyltransferase family 87